MFKNVPILQFLELKNSNGSALEITVTKDFDFEKYKNLSKKGKLPKANLIVALRGN